MSNPISRFSRGYVFKRKKPLYVNILAKRVQSIALASLFFLGAYTSRDKSLVSSNVLAVAGHNLLFFGLNPHSKVTKESGLLLTTASVFLWP